MLSSEDRTPISKMNLGELVREMQIIAHEDSTVLIIPEDKINEVPGCNVENFKRYYELARALDKKETYW